ncbi:MAG: heme exporter protein CcmB [Pseudomonadota bacterium]
MAGFVAFAGATLARDAAIAFKAGGGWLLGLVFYAIFVTLAAFAIGPEAAALRPNAVAIIWLAALFALQFAAADMFTADFDDGTLKVLASEQSSLLPYVIGKTAAVFLVSAAPLILATPAALSLFAVPASAVWSMTPAIAVGALGLILAALAASAINTALVGGGRFAAILAAPLSVPVLIFGVGASRLVLAGEGVWTADFQLLAASVLFLGVAAPGFAVLSLRLGLE